MTPTMLTMQVQVPGGKLVPTRVPRPVPAATEVLVRVHACGLNFADTLMVAGKYQEKHAMPFAPGIEVCGTIVETGRNADDAMTGKRVACIAGHGGLSEYVCVDAAGCVPAPARMPDAEVAGFLVAYGTSHVALDVRAQLQSGETLLVLGASGGVGLTAVEIGRILGANVIAVARGPEKKALAAAAGAHHVLDSESDIRQAVKSLGGADVVYDPVGGKSFEAALRCCNPMARLLPVGFASGTVPQIPANILLVKNLTVHGLYWGAYARLAPDILRQSFERLFDWYDQGLIATHVSRTLPLAEAEAGLDLLRNRQATGKIVVTVDADTA